jgi:cytidylate kinase
MTSPHAITIAIDGPASSGKGTAAKNVAQALDYAYIDTGAMYRTVALFGMEQGVPLKDGAQIGPLAAAIDFNFRWDGAGLRIIADGRDVSTVIRTERVGMGASDVGVVPEVRAALLGQQRALGLAGGVVMDGRDIGTVVLPGADLKIYLDASAPERARRRHAELVARGIEKTYEEVLTEITDRDHQDKNRAAAPLMQADDAVYLDTTAMDIQAVGEAILSLAEARISA